MTILVTGGAGFIGSAFLNLFVPAHPEHEFVNLDKLTYAANLENLSTIEGHSNYRFVRLDLADSEAVRDAIAKIKPDWVFHFAAESHVDRSIVAPADFVFANVVGTYNLLQACRELWGERRDVLFHHVSTDEVFGSLGEEGLFHESTAYDPRSPYSASKAASDHFVRAYHHTYGMPVKITNCSNNYGPRQFPEKLIPLMILNAVEGKPLPVYGQGVNVRDWLYVDDHCRAIWAVANRGAVGETYCVGGNNEVRNIDVVKRVCAEVARQTGRPAAELERLITFVTDRPGHDHRYAIDNTRIKSELGWEPQETFETGLAKTVAWYLSETEWVQRVKSGAYQDWVAAHYGQEATV